MLLCLSSAATPRYRQDILRALAMPAGAQLQFRYRTPWIAQGLNDRVRSNKLRKQKACIAYIDQSNTAQTPEIAPVRAAKVLSTSVQGEFCVVELELAGFAYAPDLSVFNKQLNKLSGNLPGWVNGKLEGHYFEEIDDKTLSLNLNADIGEWQKLCKSLAAYTDFHSQALFYRFERIRSVASGKPVKCRASMLRLVSGDIYDLQLLHFSPTKLSIPSPLKNDDLNWLLADADDKAITFVSTKALAVDSDYDIKTIRIRAITTTVPIYARVSLSRCVPGATKPEEAIWDFDLQVRVRPRWWTLTWQGLLVGAPVAAQGLILALNNKSITNQETVAIWVTVAGLLAGLFASYGLRKP